jgi:hypothetical protein
MQFGALGSTVHGPEVTVNLSVFGGSGDGGGDGGGDGSGGGGGGGGGGDGCEHTRQPDAVKPKRGPSPPASPPEDHWIAPGPKMKLEGPEFPMKPVNVPDGWLGIRR